MVPKLPGSLPPWITPGCLVILAQTIGLSFLVALLGAWWDLSLPTALLLWSGLALLFFLLAWRTGGQSSWIAVAASYGELGAWLGSLTSAAFFVCFFVSNTRPQQGPTFFFALLCTTLLGWLPGLLAGLGVSLLFWLLGGWLLASLHQHKSFPAHDDAHQGLLRVGAWFGVLGALGLWLELSPVLWAFGLLLLLSGAGLGSLALWSLRRRAFWLGEVRAGRVARWELRPQLIFYLPLLPLSNREAHGLLLVYHTYEEVPYRSHEEACPVALY
jgi:hypothetical protein